MSSNKKLFWILWLMGMAGILSFLFVDLSALIAAVPVPEGQSTDNLPPMALLKVISLIQPTVLLTLAVLLGVWLTKKVDLHAPAVEAYARGESVIASLKPQILPGIIAGIAGGVAIVGCWVVAKPFLSPVFVTRAEEFNKVLPVAVRFFYGGFTEELLLRWGLMTLLVWIAWRLFQKGEGTPRGVLVVGAILVSSIVFGLGHLPVAHLLAGGLTVSLVAYVITANSIFGIFAGLLYWRRGLESAMIAHVFAHVVLVTAIALSV